MKSIKNGIVLAGGNGTRLGKLTSCGNNKHMLNIGDQFIIDYPLRTLKEMGVENLTVVLGGSNFEQVVKYLKDGKVWGFNINFVYQEAANGIGAAINLCKNYVKNDNFVVCLGDNLFENPLKWDETADKDCAQIALIKHPELKRFGVASIKNNKIVNLQEKPLKIDYNFDNYAITGVYLFTPEYFEFFKNIKPSARGEFEVVNIIEQYHRLHKLKWTTVEGDLGWHDLGTHESIAYVNNYFYNKNNGTIQTNK